MGGGEGAGGGGAGSGAAGAGLGAGAGAGALASIGSDPPPQLARKTVEASVASSMGERIARISFTPP
jgi:hypothetical protein